MLPFITQPAVAPAYQMAGSLLFRGEQSLNRTLRTPTNREKWALSMWLRPAVLRQQYLLLAGSYDALWFAADGTLKFSSNNVYRLVTRRVFSDPAGYYHLLFHYDAANPTPALRLRMFVNGVEETSFTTDIRATVSVGQCAVNTPILHEMFSDAGSTIGLQGYAGETVFVDGGLPLPQMFGETDPATASWRPKKLSGIDFGTNGVHLGYPWDFANLGKDYSGRGNTWTPVNFVASDVVKDSPTNVFATLNPLDKGGAFTYSGGNLSIYTDGGSVGGYRSSLELPSSGVWVAEAAINGPHDMVGIIQRLVPTYPGVGYTAIELQWGRIWERGAVQQTVSPIAEGSVVGMVANMSAGTAQFYLNGSTYGAAALLPTGGNLAFGGNDGSTLYAQGATWNFGQRPFAFPNAYGSAKPLCTTNLPATTGQTTGTFIGNANADGPCIYSGAVPQTLVINGNAVTWGTHADRLATGFKLRTASASYNGTGSNTWTATYDRKPTVGRNHVPANAQANP